jgi:hypothetical protein
MINCESFKESWNEWLDSRPALSEPPPPDLAKHAESCDACRRIAVGLDQLRMALDHAPLPQLEVAQTRLFVEAANAELVAIERRVRVRQAVVRIGLAASVISAAGSMWFLRTRPLADRGPAQELATSRTLEDVLLDAGEATVDIALSTSEPATRLGRQVLGGAAEGLSDWVPKEAPETNAPPGQPSLLANVGRRFEERVKPISGTAQQAFRFLSVIGTRRSQQAGRGT